MTTGTKLALVLGLLAAIGGGLYFGFMDGKDAALTNNETETVSTSTPVNTQTNGKKMAFEQFARQGGTYKCTVNQSVGGVETKGTVYLSNKMLRGDFTANYGGQNMTITFVAREGYTYSWNSMMPTNGFKLKGDASGQTGDVNANASGSIQVALQQIGDYSCEDWSADASLFVVPANISFKELN